MERSGVINIYKEAGYTSHDVVAKLRGIVGQKKIGHTGTLDHRYPGYGRNDPEGVVSAGVGRRSPHLHSFISG